MPLCVSVCMSYLSVSDQDNLKIYEWILMKLAVNDHHQNISLELGYSVAHMHLPGL